MTKLTRNDLLIQDIGPEQFREWLQPWRGLVSGRVAPAFLNKFGCWFLRRPEGHVEMLDVFSGQIVRAADSHEELVAAVNTRDWQESFLLSDLVLQLHEAGKVPAADECYALAPHPAVGGSNPFLGEQIDPRFVMPMDVSVWQGMCAQFVLGNES